MKGLLSVLLFIITTTCSAGDWLYNGSSTEFIPVSHQLGDSWSRSLIRIVNEKNEFNGLFRAAHPVDSGVTTNYEIFRKKNKIRELSEVEFYFEDTNQKKQTYQMVIFLFQERQDLERFWNATHKGNLASPVFTALINGNHCCIFRLQNIYVRISSKALPTECERIAGLVFNMIQTNKKHSSNRRSQQSCV
jgi:hypothetical protein